MSDLRELLKETVDGVRPQTVYVYNTGLGESINDGGRCCGFVVPSQYTIARAELWGGGGGGAGGCCCQYGACGASPGQYVIHTFAVTSGQVVTICAGGSTTCALTCCGICGNPSFITYNSSIVACAAGGTGAQSACFFNAGSACGIISPSGIVNNSGVGDLVFCQYTGVEQAGSCYQDSFGFAMGTPKLQPTTRKGVNACVVSVAGAGCARFKNHWPSGAAGSAGACGGACCWGGWGAGGIVSVTFY